MGDWATMEWELARSPYEGMSWSQLMDCAFDIWCVTADGRTFEEFCAGAETTGATEPSGERGTP